jgi:hypothetical protein
LTAPISHHDARASGASSTAGVTVRLGLSNNRRYEELLRLKLDLPDAGSRSPAWRPVDVGLSPYSSGTWRLFYQPWRITWNLIVNVDATPGGTAAWLRPAIESLRAVGRQ